MSFFVLAETSAGYALLKAKDKKLLKKDDYSRDLDSSEKTCSLLKLKNFAKFESATQALEEINAIQESKVSPMLANMLDIFREEKKSTLVVAETKLGQSIAKLPGLQLSVISDSSTVDLYRAVRSHLTSLIPALVPSNLATMSLGLAHSLSRHKIKFSTDKVDVMIIQAIALLDDLDKELNIYAMRVKEWYGWHFPEMDKIINDNLAYAKVIKAMGMRSSASTSDLSEVLPEEIEEAVKAAAEISMGTEITSDDLEHIRALADQVISFTAYRAQLSAYLSARMQAIAPNLTMLVGELVGARLISHAGSLISLAKSPASTIQILGAEKALFRALKTKHDTPKYGLLFHASLIGQSTGKNKGKIARMLATKSAIGLRVDALSEDRDDNGALGLELRAKLEARLRMLEGKPPLTKTVSIAPQEQESQKKGKWEIKEAKKYNPDADNVMTDAPPKAVAHIQKQLAAQDSDSDQDMDEIPATAKEDLKLSKEAQKAKEKAEKKAAKEERRARKEKKRVAKAMKERPATSHAVVSKEQEDMDADAAASQLEIEAAAATQTEATKTVLPPSPEESSEAESEDSDKWRDARGILLPPDPATLGKNGKPKQNGWQSSILGNTKAAKKARKIERHERRLALSAQKREEKERLRKEEEEGAGRLAQKAEEREMKREEKKRKRAGKGMDEGARSDKKEKKKSKKLKIDESA